MIDTDLHDVEPTTVLRSVVVSVDLGGFDRCVQQWYNLHVAQPSGVAWSSVRYAYADLQPAIAMVLRAFCHLCNGRIFTACNVPSESAGKIAADLTGLLIPRQLLDLMREVIRPMFAQGWTYYPFLSLNRPSIGVAYGLGVDPMFKLMLQWVASYPGMDPVPIDGEELGVMPMVVARDACLVKIDGHELPKWRELACSYLRPLTAACFIVIPHARPALGGYVALGVPVPVVMTGVLPLLPTPWVAIAPVAGIAGSPGALLDAQTGFARYGSGVAPPAVPHVDVARFIALEALHSSVPLRAFTVFKQGDGDAVADIAATKSWRGLPARVILDNVHAMYMLEGKRFPSDIDASVPGHTSSVSKLLTSADPSLGIESRPSRGRRGYGLRHTDLPSREEKETH